MRNPILLLLAAATLFLPTQTIASPPCDVQASQIAADVDSSDAHLVQRRRGKKDFGDVVKQAIREADTITRGQKLRLRVAMAIFPEVRTAVEDHLLEVVNEQGVSIASVDALINLDDLERLLQLLIEYLPQIIELLLMLFGDDTAGLVQPAPAIACTGPPVPIDISLAA